MGRALVELAAAVPVDTDDEDDAELRARPCYRRELVAVLPARKVAATLNAEDGGEAVTLLPVVTREVRVACAPQVAGPH